MPDQLFDAWPEKYRQWFETPIGRLVQTYEKELIMGLLQPQAGETICDAGCGSGIFTQPFLAQGADVTGSDISEPMLRDARKALATEHFHPLVADMLALPFKTGHFDKCVSITALEFIEDGRRAVAELFRVTRPGGVIVVATLNSESTWAERRSRAAELDSSSIFRQAWFRSPQQLADLAPINGEMRTAVHFPKDADPASARAQEQAGRDANSLTGAFLVARWRRP